MRKRFYFFLIMAIVAMSGFAQTKAKTPMLTEAFMTEKAHKPLMSKHVRNIPANVTMPKKAARKSPKKVRLADFTWPMDGFAINSQYSIDDYTGDPIPAPIFALAFATTVNMVDENHISFIGLVEDGNVEVTVEVNLDDGSFYIPSGTLVAATEYGNVCIFNAFNDEADIIGYVTEDRIYFETMWYDLIVDGEYADYSWSSHYYLYTRVFVKKNGIMSFTNDKLSSPVDVFIFQEGNKVYVYNMLGIGAPMIIDLKEDYKFEVKHQLASEESQGDFYTYAINDEATKPISPIITGSGEGNVLRFDQAWTLYSKEEYWYGATYGTTITRTDGVDFEFPVIEDMPAVPAQPTMAEIRDYDPDKGYGGILFDVPTTDSEGKLIKESKLYYILYADIDDEISPITFTTSLYPNLNENLTEIPYSFIDNQDFDLYESHKRIWLNFDYSGYNRIGIQSVYYGGGTKNVSDIDWMDVPQPAPVLELIELPEGAEVSEWIFEGYCEEYDPYEGHNDMYLDRTYHVHVSFVGDQVYIQGISRLLPDSWVVGTLSDGVITIPKNEYLGDYLDSGFYVFCHKITLTYDSENNKITGGPILIDIKNVDYELLSTDKIDYAEMHILNSIAGRPVTPSILDTNFFFSSFPSFIFEIQQKTTDGNDISERNLWYKIVVVRKDGTFFDYTSFENLDEGTVWIPYNYEDNDIVCFDTGRRIYINDDFSNWKYIAIQSKYALSADEVYYSDYCIFEVEIVHVVYDDFGEPYEEDEERFSVVSNSAEMSGGEFKDTYWASFYNSLLPYVADENTMVYVARLSEDSSQLQLTQVPDKIIPPGQAVVLSSTSADKIKLSVTFDEGEYDFSGNALSGVDEDTDVPTDQGTIYTLSIKDSNLAFRQFTGSRLKAHKAYLAIDSYGETPIRISFDDGTTNISDIAEPAKAPDGYYTLDGRHFKGVPTSPGVYIINGEKRVIRN